MPDINTLLRAIARCTPAQQDVARELREQLVMQFPGTLHADEANYRLGLDALMAGRNLAAATHYFTAAMQSKSTFWASAARTSLALCLLHQNQRQRALFELRKVAFGGPANFHTITALGFLENMLVQAGEAHDAQVIQHERATQLKKLIQGSKERLLPAAELGFYQHQLGLLLAQQGQAAAAQQLWQQALGLGKAALGEQLYTLLQQSLAKP